MQYFSTLALIFVGVLLPGAAQYTFASSDPYCYGKTPKSAMSTALKSSYVVMGKCDMPQRFNEPTTVLWRSTGTYEPDIGRTTEDIVVLAARLDEPSQFYGRSQTVMRCLADPWLTTDAICDGTVASASAPLNRINATNTIDWGHSSPLGAMIAEKINHYRRPYGSIVNDGARKDLNSQYQHYDLVQYKTNPNMLQSTAPIITSPQPNARVTSSSFKIQIAPSNNLTGTHILVQFTKTDGPPNQLRPTYAWRRLTSELANGAYLPTDIVTKGQWTLRARIDAPQLGDFSADVPFTYEPAIATKPRKGIGM